MQPQEDVQFSLQPVHSAVEVQAIWQELERTGGIPSSLPGCGSAPGCVAFRRTFVPVCWSHELTEDRSALRFLFHVAGPDGGILNLRQYHLNSTGDPELDCVMIEHNGFVGTAQSNCVLWPAFLSWAPAALLETDEFLVPGIVDGLIGFNPESLPFLQSETTESAFASPLAPGGMDAVLGLLSRNARQQLRRNMRELEALGELQCELATDVETALSWFCRMKEFHIESWIRRGRRHAFRHDFFETFHRALIACGVADGSVQMLRISAGRVAVGYLYNFHHGSNIVAYQSGFDPARPELRLGYVCHALAMEMGARAGARRYDFLAGDNQLKRTFGKTHYTMHWLRFSRPSFGLRLEHAARAVRRTLARD